MGVKEKRFGRREQQGEGSHEMGVMIVMLRGGRCHIGVQEEGVGYARRVGGMDFDPNIFPPLLRYPSFSFHSLPFHNPPHPPLITFLLL